MEWRIGTTWNHRASYKLGPGLFPPCQPYANPLPLSETSGKLENGSSSVDLIS
ncbi:hypothetical protein SCLCIDRAFT_1222113 [Scleroderma citrinum Foug A]|uniref:Uncharacterized protein n=1 Tax=Scleroderma citrinum Foug A TaxID=1036808 RepID=A0A0C3DDY7_9AGAM|nr:hypothetical protein SCLCIDRAFT_1222113 [Scleroderma citrinum Foug A]